MRVLVAYASRHGSTAEIAERIACRLSDIGVDADCVEVGDVHELGEYDAFVVGSATYMFHWMKEATSFVTQHETLLASRPTWVFGSGPLGDALFDDEGRDVLSESRPKEFAELQESIRPRDLKVFFGAWNPEAPAKGFAERVFRMMPKSKDVLPSGDFRDWAEIEAWADQIAVELETVQPLMS